MLSLVNTSERKRRVLILDDEPAIRFTLSAILKQVGYDVITVADGQEALEKATQFEPDVAILDVFVPGLNGVAVGIRLVALFPCCEVILFSGVNDASPLLEEAVRQGYRFEVLGKPVSPAVLLETVRTKLEGGDLRKAA